jgi:hypothetical protein
MVRAPFSMSIAESELKWLTIQAADHINRRMNTEALGRKALTEALRSGAGLKQSHASDLVRGHRSPSLELALVIEEKTGIPPSFWRAENRGEAMWERILVGMRE